MNIKHYTSSFVFIKTINPKDIRNEITFSEQINGGLGTLKLQLNTEDTFSHGDIIRLYDEKQLVYTGIIMNKRLIQKTVESFEIECSGLSSLLSLTVPTSSGNYEYTIDDSISDALSDVIDNFNTKYNYLTKNIDILSDNVNIDIDGDTSYQVITEITNNAAGYFWNIGADNVFRFKQKATQTVHRITLEKDIAELDVDMDGYDIYNKLALHWKDELNQESIYTDTASIALYGIREKHINDTTINNSTTANSYGANFLAENSGVKNVATVEIYGNALDYKVGDYFKILNTKTDYGNLHIVKKTVYENSTVFTLDKNTNFISYIKNNGNTNN